MKIIYEANDLVTPREWKDEPFVIDPITWLMLTADDDYEEEE